MFIVLKVGRFLQLAKSNDIPGTFETEEEAKEAILHKGCGDITYSIAKVFPERFRIETERRLKEAIDGH